METLLIPQSLEIQYLCINDAVGYYTNWGRLNGNGRILWSLQDSFTSPTLISLFNIINPSDTPIMQTLQDFNSDPTSYIHTTHTINAFFVDTTDTYIATCLQDISYVISAFIPRNNLFHHATLWIPHTYCTTSLKDFYTDFISSSLTTSWTFTMQLSHTTDLGQSISDHQYLFHIFQQSDKISKYPHQTECLYPSPDITMDYFRCLDVSIAHHP